MSGGQPLAALGLRGEFEAKVAGAAHRFDTTLATVAAIEERCGDAAIVEILNRVLFRRRARDLRALLTAALATSGLDPEAASARADRASLAEAEGFALALIGALGFEVASQPTSDGERPLAGASNGAAGGSSASVS